MAWRIRWHRDDRQANLALMRRELELWVDDRDRVVLEAPPEGWIWATLTEEEQGATIQWHEAPGDVGLERRGEDVDVGDAGREWSLQAGDELVFEDGETRLQILGTAVSVETRTQFVDRERDGYEVDADEVRRLWQLHRRLAMGEGWERLLEEVEERAGRWPGLAEIEGCGVIVWEGDGEFYHRVRWLDREGGGGSEGEEPMRPGALASLLTRERQLQEALRERRQVVVRHHEEDLVDLLIPIWDEEFVGALYLLGPRGEDFEPEGAWRLVDIFEPAGVELIRRYRSDRNRRSLEEENRYFRDRERRHYLFKDLVCESEAMREVYDELHRRVETDAPIWLVGEAGTGKELLARALHHLGERQEGMIIRMDCANFPQELVNYELFGCVASELTGAVAARKGIFELAREGTVFLDEVDRLSRMVQGKLVRLLEEREVRRIGDAVGRPIDARLVASSHRDLERLCERGEFRRDLYELLGPHRLDVPPLRDRGADIMPLARIFLEKFVERYGAKCRRISDELAQWLTEYDWPGNVRQLQTVMEAAVLVARERRVVEYGDLVMENASESVR